MKLDRILKRHFAVVIGGFVTVAAFLHAQAVTHVVGFRLAPDAEELAATPSGSHPPRARAAEARGAGAKNILMRNPFDSVTGDLSRDSIDVEVPDGGGASPPAREVDPMRAAACEGLKVVAIAASTDPDWSFASFTVPSGSSDERPIMRRRGTDVSGKTVTFIGWDRVWLSTGKQLCQLAMFQPPAPPPAARAKPAAKGTGDGLTAEISKGIHKVNATEFKVERGVIDRILENSAVLMTQVRLVPDMDGDRSTGIKVFGVRPDSLLGNLGMENGDRIQTINGFDMTNPENALEVYALLHTASHLTVAVSRKGVGTNLDYSIQ